MDSGSGSCAILEHVPYACSLLRIAEGNFCTLLLRFLVFPALLIYAVPGIERLCSANPHVLPRFLLESHSMLLLFWNNFIVNLVLHPEENSGNSH